jgi:hypothetical protein
LDISSSELVSTGDEFVTLDMQHLQDSSAPENRFLEVQKHASKKTVRTLLRVVIRERHLYYGISSTYLDMNHFHCECLESIRGTALLLVDNDNVCRVGFLAWRQL